MKNFNDLKNTLVRLTVFLVVVFALSGLSFAQIKLRNALDYDGDGKADASVFRGLNSTWYLLKSNGSVTSGMAFGTSNTDTIAPGDYDGDGKGDLAVWRYSNGTFYYLASGTNTYLARQFGLIGDEVISRDYVGDNKTDFAVVRRAAGTNGAMTWYIYNSQTGAVTSAQFGLSSDAAMPGDYDGDGKFDIAVQRKDQTTGAATVYIAGSLVSVYGVQFGLGTDLYAPGDYDGDGKTDIAAVRKAGGTLNWYILKSSDGSCKPPISARRKPICRRRTITTATAKPTSRSGAKRTARIMF